MANIGIDGFGMLGTNLQQLLMSDSIQAGTKPGYELCKTLYTEHPMGAKIVDFPIAMAQFKPRKLTVPKAPDDGLMLVEAFEREWKELQAERHIFNTARLARMYGVATLGILVRDGDASLELDFKSLSRADIGFNSWDPLNTAGSLILNQDPNALDYQKVAGVNVGGKPYHRSRVCVVMNEDPIYIDYQPAGFGFNGRSVYQRGLVPLKSFILTLATDMMIALKAGVLIAKMESQSSAVDGPMSWLFGQKREMVKEAQTGNVLSIGITEEIESLNLQNLDGAYLAARKNIIENIATACGTPAKLLLAESFAEGFGEGSEDAKAVAQFVETIRTWLDPLYRYMDQIVMHRAWNEQFYETMQSRYPDEYGKVSYTTAFQEWKNSFYAEWPSLLDEPDSEKSKAEDVKLKAIIAWVEVAAPLVDQENKARLIQWASDNMNEMKLLFASPLDLDIDAIAEYDPPIPAEEPKEPAPESASDSAPRKRKGQRERLDAVDQIIRTQHQLKVV